LSFRSRTRSRGAATGEAGGMQFGYGDGEIAFKYRFLDEDFAF
jgi:hypothetical protein